MDDERCGHVFFAGISEWSLEFAGARHLVASSPVCNVELAAMGRLRRIQLERRTQWDKEHFDSRSDSVHE